VLASSPPLLHSKQPPSPEPPGSPPPAAVLLVTLRLLGYTVDTFGDAERASLAAGVAQLLGCSSSAVLIAAVRNASDDEVAASSGARRRQLVAAGVTQADVFVLVDVAVDAVAAGLATDALAAALATLSQSSLLAYLRDAGLSKLIGAAFSAANAGLHGSDEAAAPVPQPTAILEPASDRSSSSPHAAQLLSLSMRWSVVLAVVVVVAWCGGIACGVRFRHSMHWSSRHAPRASARMPRFRLPALSMSSDDGGSHGTADVKRSDSGVARRTTLLEVQAQRA
jgi:hypothetical protein